MVIHGNQTSQCATDVRPSALASWNVLNPPSASIWDRSKLSQSTIRFPAKMVTRWYKDV